MVLTIKQRKFAELYAASGNATQSAVGAGYSEKTADVIACENLRKPSIAAYIGQLGRDGHNDRIATAVERQEFWSAVVRDSDAEMRDRLRASEILGKAQGDFIDKMENRVSVDMTPEVADRVLRGCGINPEDLNHE